MSKRLKHPLLMHLAVYGFYLLVAAVVTYPLVTQLSTALAGFVYGDGYEMAHHVWWFKHALQSGQNPFFQSLLAYPDGIAGVTVWANPLQSFPAWLLAFALPLPVAVNLQILLTLALNGWAMFWLVRYLMGIRARCLYETYVVPLQTQPNEKDKGAGLIGLQSKHPAPTRSTAVVAGLVAGLLYMLYPTIQGHVGVAHLGQIVQWTMPLYVYALLRLRESGTDTGHSGASRWWGRIGLAAGLFVLGAWGHTLQLITVLLPVTVVYGLWLVWRREWAALARTAFAVVIGGVLLALFLLPVFQATLGTSAYTGEGGTVRYSADLLGIVTPSFRHPLFGRLEYTHRVLGVNIDEGTAYLGVIAAGLALVGAWKVRESRWWLALALAAWVLSLGPLLKIFDQPVTFAVDGYASYVMLPFALVSSLPVISLARAPGRFNYTVALAVAVLVGYGAAWLWARVRVNSAIKWAVAIVLMAGIIFEYQTFFPLPTSPAAIPQAVADLAERDVRAVLDLPWDSLIAAKQGMYLQTAHQHPLIAGHETRRTPVSPAKLTLLQATLDPALLRSVGADVVIIHREQDEGTLEARAREQLGEPLYEDAQIALFETPLNENVPTFTVLPTSAETITTQADSYVYAPEDGWVNFTAGLTADEVRAVSLLLDGVVAQRWTVNGDLVIALPLPVDAGSFHTVTLALEPPCPEQYDPALECRSVNLANAGFDYTNAEATEPIQFEHGVTLARANVPATAGETLPVWLWWQFDEGRSESDIRFVHITDTAGELVGQNDTMLGEIAAGETRAEQVEIALGDALPPGEYTVSAGWYSYPEIDNFCVLDDVGACSGDAAVIGTFALE